MAINKVVYGNNTLVDLTGDTVEASNLLEGETAHDKSGNPVTGTAKQGHIVQNDSGTDMTQRSKVQFVGIYTEDDSTNEKTRVNIVREMTKEQMDALSGDEKKGFIRTTNEPDNPYEGNGSVSVTADGVKNYGTLLNELFALVDSTKITQHACIDRANIIYQIGKLTSAEYDFSWLVMGGSAIQTQVLALLSSGSKFYVGGVNQSGLVYNDYSASVPTSGDTITLYY